MDWKNIFDREFHKNQGATQEEIDSFCTTWNRELSPEEIKEINDNQSKRYQPFDPSLWIIPKKTFPTSYLEFLQYSNGGEFGSGDRYFQFFSTYDLREMNFAYEFPEYVESFISFAMDGCGNHLVFDMRQDKINDEYPILAVSSVYLDYDASKLIGSSFLEVCKAKTSIDQMFNE